MIKKICNVGCFTMLVLVVFGIYLLALDPELFARLTVMSEAEVVGMYAFYLLAPILVAVVYFAIRKRVRKPYRLIDDEDDEDAVFDSESEQTRFEPVIKSGKPILFLILLLAAIIINFFAVRRIWVFSTVMGDSTAYVKEEDHWVEYQRDGLVLNINDRAGYSEELLAANLDSVDEDDLKRVADKYTIVVSNC